ncbi:MAG: biotin/lipoyl-binding protein [Elusimicrobia bacterium]|nr:biotin/lipoyl-binding protein [Elusimicrobiota bacterium]
MEIEKIKSILDAIKDTDIEEIWFEKGGEKSGFRRRDISSLPASSSDKIIPEESWPRDKEPIQKNPPARNQIKSTMVGTFLRSVTPGGKPLVEEGDFVSIDQKVCIVEAMKVMKELTSQVAGKIVKVLVADNHPVEYGQPLFEVEPQNRHGTNTHGTDTE